MYGRGVDSSDRILIEALQRDATTSYADLGRLVGLSAGAAHERVRKLRDRGVITRTTVEVDPAAVGRGVLAFVTIDATAWMGGPDTAAAVAAITAVEEAHIVAGGASMLLKVRAATTAALQEVLRAVFDIPGVRGTNSIVVLQTLFERPVDPTEEPSHA